MTNLHKYKTRLVAPHECRNLIRATQESENHGAPEYLIGSSDLRPRNLRRRVELLVPILNAEHRARLDQILDMYLTDATGWDLATDGRYVQRDRGAIGAQTALAQQASSLASIPE